MVSSLSQRAVRKDVAMTGEITLRGNVLPVGGVQGEGSGGAARARHKRFILPHLNRRDMDEIPKELFGEMQFIFVENVRESSRGAQGEAPPAAAPVPRPPRPPQAAAPRVYGRAI